MAINQEAIKIHIRGLLEALGDDPDRAGLKETPERVAGMFAEMFEGMNYTNHEIAVMFGKTFEEEYHEGWEDLVVVRDIEVFSHCEHHLALMYDMRVTVAYLPNNKVIGLSKIARVVDMVAKRLQLQERIGADIAQIIQEITCTEDVAIIIEARHSCMTARGICCPSAKTRTQTLRGRFISDGNLQRRIEA